MDADIEFIVSKVNTKSSSSPINLTKTISDQQDQLDLVNDDDDDYYDYYGDEENENLYEVITERNLNQSKQQHQQRHQINESTESISHHRVLPRSASDNSLLVFDNLDHSLDNVKVELTPMPSIISSPFHRVMSISRIGTPVIAINNTDNQNISNNNTNTNNEWQLNPTRPRSTTPRLLMDFLNISSHDVKNPNTTSRSRRSTMTIENVSTNDKLTSTTTNNNASTSKHSPVHFSPSPPPPPTQLSYNNNHNNKKSTPNAKTQAHQTKSNRSINAANSSGKSSSHATSVEDEYEEYEQEIKSSATTNAHTDNNNNGDKYDINNNNNNNNEPHPTAATVASANNNNNPPIVPLHERHRYEFYTIIAGGVALAFNSGLINGITLQARGVPVSHVTGTTSHAGMSLAQHDNENAAIYIALIVCFIFGSMITGLLMPSNSFKLGGQYGPLFVIGSLLLMIACIIAYERPESYWYFYFAAMSSGLQNGITTKYSGSIIRTTHVTGSVTDIGLVIGRLIKGDRKEFWKLKVLVPLFFGFLLGSFASIKVYAHFGKLSLMINVLIFFTIGLLYSFMIRLKLSVPLWRVLFGAYRLVDKTSELGKEGITKAAKNVNKISKVMKVKIKKINKKLSESNVIHNPLHHSSSSSSSTTAATQSKSQSQQFKAYQSSQRKSQRSKKESTTTAVDARGDDDGVIGFTDDNYLE